MRLLLTVGVALACCASFAMGWQLRGDSGERKAESAQQDTETCVVMASLAVSGWQQCLNNVERAETQLKMTKAWLIDTGVTR